jgi:predicted acetyltransferase
MAIAITTPTEDQWPEMFEADCRAFGFSPDPGEIEMRRPLIDLSRFRIAVDRRQIVGVAGSYGFDVTLPGGATVPMSGVTWVSVAATHRRGGLLTRLMEACHADAHERGEPVAMLFASEGGIYERFGYGIATEMRGVTVERTAARFRHELSPDRGAVQYLGADEAAEHRQRLWPDFRRLRPGELSRDAAWHHAITTMWSKPRGGMSHAFFLAHDQGYAAYRIADKWTAHGPQHRMEISELAALTQQAHLDLWHTIIGVDLVATIDQRALPLDDPLPYYFTDGRVVRTTSLKDGLWANVLDVGVCFGARAYGTADRMVIESAGKRWAIEHDGVESSCRPVRTRPDLIVSRSSLGALLLGGVRASQLVAAGRITPRSDGAARRADAFFLATPAPNCQTYF